MYMPILVIGGTGTVGSQVVSRLLGKGLQVRCLVRSKEKAKALPAGVEGVIGDLDTPATLGPAFDNIERAFLITVMSPNETEKGVNAVSAAGQAGVRLMVYQSVAHPEDSLHIPHFKSKIPVEQALKASGMDHAVVQPNNFFQNDLWFREAIQKSRIYPQPIGSVGLNRIDARDIADAVVNILTRPELANHTYELHGSQRLTGEDVAQTWSRHLGIKVRYAGDDLAAWEKQAREMLPGWMVADLRTMYRYFQQKGLQPEETSLTRQKKVVGHEPRKFDDFVRETAAAWNG
jgi:uncharacterized protein YbjT (DUF2867 family)